MDVASVAGTFDSPGICALCHRILASEDDDVHDFETISNICGDCKFLFFEDGGTATPLSQDIQRRTPRVRQARYNNSSESIENLFSQQFSSMINLARHNQTVVSDLDNQSVDSVQRTSSRSTPIGSRRWRRVVSDTESDGFDSVYGESDVISYGAYVDDSDASVEVDSFLGETDTDIDPMHAGLNQWSSDNDEEEWEEAEASENTLGSLIARVHLRRSMESDGPTHPVNWHTETRSPEMEGAVHIRISERRQVQITNPFGNTDDHSGDYLDARSFEELLERLAEADNSRRGAPPASVSFVKNLERVVVNKEDHNGLACAICKDFLCVGSLVNRLPCLHLYHPSCIKPWLSTRNSCPLCRYELPTDDMDYENRKQRISSSNHVEETPQQEEGKDTSFQEDHEAPEMMMNDENGNGNGSRSWLFVAAPVVSLVGIAVAFWLGNSGSIRNCGSTYTPNQRGGNRSRRWWSLF